MKKLNELSLKEKIGQMIGLAFSGGEYSEELAYQIEEIEVGLVIYFKDNCLNPKQIFNLNKKILEKAKIPPFISLDQEGGMVARVTEGITQSPGAMVIGATNNFKNAYHLAYNMGRELRDLGFNFNFAPVADINNNALNPVINVRSYSENPEIVSKYVLEATKGYTDAMIMTSLKHFPGHGDTAVDSHIGLPKVDFDLDRLEKMELVPFKMAVEQNLPGIMASHVMFNKFDSKFPTTLSEKIITGLLRNKMGYDGLVVTDSLTMKAVFDNFSIEEIVLHGFNSGCDILLLCGARDIAMQKEFADCALRLAEEGKISIDKINKSVERILRYKEMFKVGEMAEKFADIEADLLVKERRDLASKVMDDGLTLIKNENNLLPLKENDRTLVIFPKIKVVTLVDNSDNTLNCLADFLPFHVARAYYNLNPSQDEINDFVELTKKYEKIIFCSYNACFNKAQAELINKIDQNKQIVVAIRTPYDIKVLDCKAYLCSYEASVLSFQSLAKVLTGKISAKGILPVTVE